MFGAETNWTLGPAEIEEENKQWLITGEREVHVRDERDAKKSEEIRLTAVRIIGRSEIQLLRKRSSSLAWSY
jgi:hypothetical protein